MSQLSRKISDEITVNSTSRSQKNSRTGGMAGAGSGQQERMQVRPQSVELTDMASAMTARGRWRELIGDYDTSSSCKAFHIDATGPFLNQCAGLRTLHRLLLTIRGRNIRGSFRPSFHTERESATNTMPHDVSRTIGVCRWLRRPKDYCVAWDSSPDTSCATTTKNNKTGDRSRRLRGRTVHGTTIWEHR